MYELLGASYFIQLIEIAILMFVVVWQVRYYQETKKDIAALEYIFPDRSNFFLVNGRIKYSSLDLFNTDNLHNVLKNTATKELEYEQLIEDKKTYILRLRLVNSRLYPSEHLSDIINDINAYLFKNTKYATEFPIIQDITERHSERLGNKVELSLNMPLYLGLLGTIVGVIFGVGQLGFIDSAEIESVRVLMRSVSVAMFVSGFGLFLTVLNSRLYKEKNTDMEKGRNDFYTFVQTQLLPVMSDSMMRAVSSLKSNLDKFNDDFRHNLNTFSSSTRNVMRNLEQQEQFLNRLETIEMRKMIDYNINLYKEMHKGADTFKGFLAYLDQLHVNSNQLSSTANKIEHLFNRFTTFESDLKVITNRFNQQEDVYQKLFVLLAENYEDLETRKDRFIAYINNLDGEMKGALSSYNNNLKELLETSENETKDRKNALKIYLAKMDNEMQEGVEALNEHSKARLKDLRKMAQEEIMKISSIYEDHQFSFDNLKYLEKIESHMDKVTQVLDSRMEEINIHMTSLQTVVQQIDQKQLALKPLNHLEDIKKSTQQLHSIQEALKNNNDYGQITDLIEGLKKTILSVQDLIAVESDKVLTVLEKIELENKQSTLSSFTNLFSRKNDK